MKRKLLVLSVAVICAGLAAVVCTRFGGTGFPWGSGAVRGEVLETYARAAAVYSEGRFEEAAEMLGRADAALAGFLPALVLRGKAEFFSGESGAAERSFRRVLKRRPAAAEASLYLARILREEGKTAGAAALAEGILGDDPSDLRALRLAAELARERGPSGEAEALAFLDRAAEASLEAALVFLDRARIRWIAGKGEDALEDLFKARTLLSRDTPLMRAVENLESVIRGRML